MAGIARDESAVAAAAIQVGTGMGAVVVLVAVAEVPSPFAILRPLLGRVQAKTERLVALAMFELLVAEPVAVGTAIGASRPVGQRVVVLLDVLQRLQAVVVGEPFHRPSAVGGVD